jgi:hypothetical protein
MIPGPAATAPQATASATGNITMPGSSHWQRSQPGAPSARGPLPVPVESGPASHDPGPVNAGRGSRTALRTWRVLKFRLWRARALQPLANAHGAAVTGTVPCSPTRSRARATRPPAAAGLTAAPQSPLRPSPDARGTGANWQWAGRGPGPSMGAESKKRHGLRPELARDCRLPAFLPRTKGRASSCRLHLYQHSVTHDHIMITS